MDFQFQDTQDAPVDAGLNDRLAGMGGGADDITSSFGVLKLRGKVWQLRLKGEEHIFRNAPDYRDPAARIKVVILDAAPKSRMLFKPYVKGSNEKPLCWSNDMIAPDSSVPEDQVPRINGKAATTCAHCPMNAIGSSMGSGGKPGRACKESKRMAMMVHPDNLRSIGVNLDGAVKFSLPAGSFTNFKNYSEWLWNTKKARPIQVWTELSFDPKAEFPQVVFQPVGWVDGSTLHGAFEVLDGPSARTILAPPKMISLPKPQSQFGGVLDGAPPPLPERAAMLQLEKPEAPRAPAPAPAKKTAPAGSAAATLTAQPQSTSEILSRMDPALLEQLRKMSAL